MSKLSSVADRLAIPTLGFALAILALVPDLIGIGTPGIGAIQMALLVISVGCIFSNLFLQIRPVTILGTMLRNSNVGWREILILSVSVVVTGVTADLVLGLILPPSYVADTKYGWRTPANKTLLRKIEDTTGQSRQITVRYFQDGFKRWGNTKTDKRKLFVIGDSVTEMTQVSNGEEWYSYLESRLSNIELFVYGGGGYGSLQEYMVLDDYIDTINPDLILWQFCSNDYANNLYELDLSSYPFNNHAFRPYLQEDNTIVLRLPLPYETLRKYSFIADRLLKEYDLLMWRRATQDLDAYFRDRAYRAGRDTEHEVARRKLLRDKSYYVTLKIMKKVRERAKDIPIYLFNACRNLSEQESKICSATGIVCLPEISEYLGEKEREGRQVRVPNDGHWNKLGNQLAGERLVRYFTQFGYSERKK